MEMINIANFGNVNICAYFEFIILRVSLRKFGDEEIVYFAVYEIHAGTHFMEYG